MLFRSKPRSRTFFDSIAGFPRALGASTASALVRDHGDRWPEVIERHSRAWMAIDRDAASDRDDFYDGRLGEIGVPVLLVHGARDPRTEPGEIEALADSLSRPAGRHRVVVLPEGGHSPHSEPATSDEVTRLVQAFVDRPAEAIALQPPAQPARRS